MGPASLVRTYPDHGWSSGLFRPALLPWIPINNHKGRMSSSFKLEIRGGIQGSGGMERWGGKDQ